MFWCSYLESARFLSACLKAWREMFIWLKRFAAWSGGSYVPYSAKNIQKLLVDVHPNTVRPSMNHVYSISHIPNIWSCPEVLTKGVSRLVASEQLLWVSALWESVVRKPLGYCWSVVTTRPAALRGLLQRPYSASCLCHFESGNTVPILF